MHSCICWTTGSGTAMRVLYQRRMQRPGRYGITLLGTEGAMAASRRWESTCRDPKQDSIVRKFNGRTGSISMRACSVLVNAAFNMKNRDDLLAAGAHDALADYRKRLPPQHKKERMATLCAISTIAGKVSTQI